MPVFNYNNVLYGSRVLTIASVGYVAENVSVSRPTTVLTRENEVGEPNGFVSIQDWVTCNGTLQIPTSGSSYPQLGGTFTASFNSGSAPGGAEYWVIESIDMPESQRELKKVSFTARRAGP
jgi:hypothetical protein